MAAVEVRGGAILSPSFPRGESGYKTLLDSISFPSVLFHLPVFLLVLQEGVHESSGSIDQLRRALREVATFVFGCFDPAVVNCGGWPWYDCNFPKLTLYNVKVVGVTTEQDQPQAGAHLWTHTHDAFGSFVETGV